MLDQTHNYNELIPPSNPDYPWKGKDWEPLCYYCNQPIQMSKPWAGYRQRVIWHWEHVFPTIEGNKHRCDPAKLRPTEEIDDPRCHVCGTQGAGKHGSFCSMAGKPPFRATPMSRKEEELQLQFGWHSEIEEQEKKQASIMEAIGVLTVAGAIIGLFAWIGKRYNGRTKEIQIP
jgi:hypothetical protein